MKASEISKLFVVEWSEKQQAFHIHQVEDMLRENLDCYYHRRDPDESDWMVVGVVSSHQAARDVVASLRKSMDLPTTD